MGRAVQKNLDFLPLRQFDKVSSFFMSGFFKEKILLGLIFRLIFSVWHSKQGSLVFSMHDLRDEEFAPATLTGKVTPLKRLLPLAFRLPYKPSIYSPCEIRENRAGMCNVSQVRSRHGTGCER